MGVCAHGEENQVKAESRISRKKNLTLYKIQSQKTIWFAGSEFSQMGKVANEGPGLLVQPTLGASTGYPW